LIADYSYQVIENQIAAQIRERNMRLPDLALPDKTITTKIPLFNQDGAPNPDPAKPYIVTTGLTAKSDRAKVPYSLHVSGWINNTGGGTAYNAFLHIIAMNGEGTAVDRNYSFTGITPHMNLGLDFKFSYQGSEIINCTVTPIYTDALTQQAFNCTIP
jgi:hypothetical protein